MRRMARLTAMAAVLGTLVIACDEENPFRNTTPRVSSGQGQVWELALDGFPSGWAASTGTRFFVGTATTPTNGTWVLDAGGGGELVFRPFSEVAPGLSVVRFGVLDLTESQGAQTFEGVRTAPESGYESDPVEVVEGHVYAFRVTALGGVVVPINYGKLEVIDVGQQLPGDPSSRFIVFRWAYQNQPLNRDVTVEENEE